MLKYLLINLVAIYLPALLLIGRLGTDHLSDYPLYPAFGCLMFICLSTWSSIGTFVTLGVFAGIIVIVISVALGVQRMSERLGQERSAWKLLVPLAFFALSFLQGYLGLEIADAMNAIAHS